MGPRETVEISLVVPAFNEEKTLDLSIPRMSGVLEQMGVSYEILVINDGSTDDTKRVAREIKKKIERVRLVNLPRNMGHMYAITLGLELSKGRYVVTIDADLQDPPEFIEEMYSKVKSDSTIDVVQSIRNERLFDTFFKRKTASIYYRTASKFTGFEVPEGAADYRLMTRRVVDLLSQLPERDKIYRLLIPYFGFHTSYVFVPRQKRVGGQSAYSISKMLSLTIDSLINFSAKPLKFVINLGLATATLFGLTCICSFVLWLQNHESNNAGTAAIVSLLLFSNSIILICIGIVGEYVGRIYFQSLNRPKIRWQE